VTVTDTKPTTVRLQRRNYGRGHGYQIDGVKVAGVTTVLNAKAKPALVNWSAETTAAYAVNNWDKLADLPPAERLKKLEKARYDVVKEAALRGTEIHDFAEKIVHGEPVDVPDAHRGEVEAYARFLDEWNFRPIGSEAPVGNAQWNYAGTLDTLGIITRAGSDERALVDVKTGKGVYNETSLQLAAYRYCEFWQPKKGVEEPMPEVDTVYVAHVKPDVVDMLPVVANEEVFRQFLYVLSVWRDDEKVKEWPRIGSPVRPNEAASYE